VSFMLESLRKHKRAEPPGGRGRGAGAHTEDAVLATLTRRGPSGHSTIGRVLLVILGACVLVVLGGIVLGGMWWAGGKPPTPARRAAAEPAAKTPNPAAQNRATPLTPSAKNEAPASVEAVPATPKAADTTGVAVKGGPAAPKFVVTPEKGQKPASERIARARTVASTGDKRLVSASPAGAAGKTTAPVRVVDEPMVPLAATTEAAPASGGNIRLLPNEKPEADEFKLAVYYHTAGDFQNALIHYHAFLEKEPLNLEAHNNLGLLYQGKGLFDDAVTEFRKAISIDPKYAKAHNNLGVTLLNAGKVDAAVAEFRYLQRDDPKNIEALVNLAIALKAADHVDEAKETLIRAVALSPKLASARYNLGVIYEGQGELTHAIEHYEAFLKYAGADQASLSADVRNRLPGLRQRIAQQP
jgi:Flp pilus assembly protein TadD